MYISEFFIACEHGYIDLVKEALDEGIDPSLRFNYALRKASYHNHYNLVKLLLKDPRVNPSDYNNNALKSAAYNNNLNILILLLEDKRTVCTSKDLNEILSLSIRNANKEVVQYLINYTDADPTYDNCYSIFEVIVKNELDIIKLLLKDKRVLKSALSFPIYYIDRIKFYVACELNIDVKDVLFLNKKLF